MLMMMRVNRRRKPSQALRRDRWKEGKKARFLTAQGEKRWWRWGASRVGGRSSMVGRPNVHHSHSTT